MQFGKTALESFGAKVANCHFSLDFRRLKELEDAVALLDQRERIEK